jgi:hypothetical protein
MSVAELAPQSHDDWSSAPPPWESDTRTKQLFERISVLEREARELTTPPDVARMRAYETTLTQVLEWLDALVAETDDERLGTFCDRLAAQIREMMFGGSDATQEKHE